MDIFVQSRGDSPDCEYYWQPCVPPQLSKISSLIQSESPSVVLARFSKKLMLLVTGLDSPEKKDFRERPIRHSIAWLCDENYDSEEQIRAIATHALQGLLANQVDKCIYVGKIDFEVSISEIEKLSHTLVNKEQIKSSPLPSSELSSKIGKNSLQLRNDIVDKLKQYNLPKKYELIVVATGVKKEKSLEQVGAWRSLSSLVKSESWRSLEKDKGPQLSFFVLAIAIIVAIVVVALITLIVLLHPFPLKLKVAPSPTPTVSPINQTMKKTTLESSTFSP